MTSSPPLFKMTGSIVFSRYPTSRNSTGKVLLPHYLYTRKSFTEWTDWHVRAEWKLYSLPYSKVLEKKWRTTPETDFSVPSFSIYNIANHWPVILATGAGSQPLERGSCVTVISILRETPFHIQPHNQADKQTAPLTSCNHFPFYRHLTPLLTRGRHFFPSPLYQGKKSPLPYGAPGHTIRPNAMPHAKKQLSAWGGGLSVFSSA